MLCLVPLLAGAGALAGMGTVDVARPQAWPALMLAAGAWIGALLLARQLRDSLVLLLAVAGGALALRGTFLAFDPELSDDVHRYVWEGALVGAGLDPYASAPDAPALASFQERWRTTWERVNHAHVPAAYPPLAQVVNAGLVALAGGAEAPERARFALRSFYALCDLLVCLPLAGLLARRGRPRALVVAWAWNPWVALEFAGAGHLDSLAILCVLLGLLCLPLSARSSGGGASLALLAAGAAIKLLPVALVPFVLRRVRRPLAGVVIFLAAGLACLLPFVLLTGHGPGAGGLGEYGFRWESFSLLYRGIEPYFARSHEYDETARDPRRLARALVLGAWLGIGFWVWARRFPPERATALLFGGFLVLTPALHPWYLTWIVPFLALYPARSWTALVAAAPLLYWPVARWRAERVWVEPAWLFPVVAGGFWALVLLDLVCARRDLRQRR